MIGLAAIRNAITPLLDATWTIGRYEAEKEQRACLYQRPEYTQTTVALGGRDTTKTLVKACQVLIHWDRNHRTTEEAALSFFEALRFNPELAIAGCTVRYIDLKDPEPIDLGSDDNGIFERLVRFDIYFEEE